MGRRCCACEASGHGFEEKRTERLPEQCRGPLTACRFTVAFTKEVVLGVGPQTYRPERIGTAFSDSLNKITSTRGFALGARLAPRFSAQQPRRRGLVVGRAASAASLTTTLENAHPFNSSAPRPPVFAVTSGPGPGSYELSAEPAPRRLPFQQQLGHGRTITVPVKVVCNRGKPLKCRWCEATVRDDFWLSKGKILCDYCKEQQVPREPRGLVLQKARDCREDHRHEGTEVAVHLRQRSAHTKSALREAYLELYFKD